MKAYINHQGVRFVGMTGFQTTQPQGILETILERLKATTLKSGKRVFIESADECVAYHNVPNVEAIAILNEYGIAVNLAGNDMLLERKTE